MTATLTPQRRNRLAPAKPPPLYNGDRLTQPEFHRRYAAMSEDAKAELVGGIVYMPPPVGPGHGEADIRRGAILTVYEAATPGVRASHNTTVILGEQSEPQPDIHLRFLPEAGGAWWLTSAACSEEPQSLWARSPTVPSPSTCTLSARITPRRACWNTSCSLF